MNAGPAGEPQVDKGEGDSAAKGEETLEGLAQAAAMSSDGNRIGVSLGHPPSPPYQRTVQQMQRAWKPSRSRWWAGWLCILFGVLMYILAIPPIYGAVHPFFADDFGAGRDSGPGAVVAVIVAAVFVVLGLLCLGWATVYLIVGLKIRKGSNAAATVAMVVAIIQALLVVMATLIIFSYVRPLSSDNTIWTAIVVMMMFTLTMVTMLVVLIACLIRVLRTETRM